MQTLATWKFGADVVAPRSVKGLEPLFALYARSALPVIDAYLSEGGRKICSVFDELDVEFPPMEFFDPQTYYNINEELHLNELADIVGQTPSLPGHTIGKQSMG
jgi:FdhD protein/molybdopterin-guanine dinucleotide biosynthesis protein A/molybdopterin-guanine dinucleotide biosynthesis protein